MSKTITVLPYTLGGKDDPHFQEDIGGNWTPDRVAANEDIYGNDDDYWSLRDEGRSFGEGESYAERQR